MLNNALKPILLNDGLAFYDTPYSFEQIVYTCTSARLQLLTR